MEFMGDGGADCGDLVAIGNDDANLVDRYLVDGVLAEHDVGNDFGFGKVYLVGKRVVGTRDIEEGNTMCV